MRNELEEYKSGFEIELQSLRIFFVSNKIYEKNTFVSYLESCYFEDEEDTLLVFENLEYHILNNICDVYYIDGAFKRKMMQCFLENNSIFTYSVFYYFSGSIQSESHFQSGLLDNVKIYYDYDGGLMRQIPYVLGKKHGCEIAYSKQGQIIEKSYKQNGLSDGCSEFYYESGKVSKVICFDKGRFIKLTEYYENGSISSEETRTTSIYYKNRNILIRLLIGRGKEKYKGVYNSMAWNGSGSITCNDCSSITHFAGSSYERRNGGLIKSSYQCQRCGTIEEFKFDETNSKESFSAQCECGGNFERENAIIFCPNCKSENVNWKRSQIHVLLGL